MKANNKIVFLGTGSSDGIPRVSCLTKTNDICETCVSSIKPNSLNRRRNTSLLIQNYFQNKIHNTVIYIGKTFGEGAIQWFPKHNAYIPDISGIPEESEKLFKNLDILIIDALRPQGFHRSHFTLEQSLEVVRKYKPKKTFLTDITCNIEHQTLNNYLKNLNLNVELAYDGLSIEV